LKPLLRQRFLLVPALKQAGWRPISVHDHG